MIKTITLESLKKLEPLLSLSFGEKISVSDEIEYFNENLSKNWFYFERLGENPSGFVRHFPIGSQEIVIELFAHEKKIALELIKNFDKTINQGIKENTKARITLKDNLLPLRAKVKEIGFTLNEKSFLYLELKKAQFYKSKDERVKYPQLKKETLVSIQKLLNEFQKFSLNKIESLVSQQKIITLKLNQEIIGVALLNNYQKSVEIVEFVINKKNRNQGLGIALLNGVSNLISKNKAIEFIYLKVKQSNKNAIRLYQKATYIEIEAKRENWLYKKYEK